jgi:hypothetical protein
MELLADAVNTMTGAPARAIIVPSVKKDGMTKQQRFGRVEWPPLPFAMESSVMFTLARPRAVDWARMATMLDCLPKCLKSYNKLCGDTKNARMQCIFDNASRPFTGHGTFAGQFEAKLDDAARTTVVVLSAAVVHQPKHGVYMFGVRVGTAGDAVCFKCDTTTAACVQWSLSNISAHSVAALCLLRDMINTAARDSSDGNLSLPCSIEFVCADRLPLPAATRDTIDVFAKHVLLQATKKVAVATSTSWKAIRPRLQLCDASTLALFPRAADTPGLASIAAFANGMRELKWTPAAMRTQAQIWLRRFQPTSIIESMPDATADVFEEALAHLCRAAMQCNFQRDELEFMLSTWRGFGRTEVDTAVPWSCTIESLSKDVSIAPLCSDTGIGSALFVRRALPNAMSCSVQTRMDAVNTASTEASTKKRPRTTTTEA